MKKDLKSHRREFLGAMAAGAVTMGMLAIPAQIKAAPSILEEPGDDLEAWFKELKGKHRMVFDAPHPNGLFPFAWPKVFLMTNEMTGTPTKENNVVVVLRHNAIPYAFSDNIWAKYKFGEHFKADDPLTKKPAIRNPFMNPKPGDFSVPGIGNVAIGINELQNDGVKFCVCGMAMTVNSAVMGMGMKKDGTEIMNDWMTGLLPGIMVVPSGVWAIGRAQENGCAYCYAG
jgi:intracellular sulfur oxidation DsrE/DsrF family protein